MFVRSADASFRRFRATGDPAALARVFDATAPELLRLARFLASSETGAEDLVQATFVTAIESAAAHDGERPVLPWLVGVLANHARAERRRDRRELDEQRLPRERAVGEDPAAVAEHRELRDGLATAIEELPEPYRPVLRLHLEHGLDGVEIARALERPRGTVRAQLSRGLDLLRRRLPAGLTAGVAVAASAGRGLAAIRADVLQMSGAPVPGGAGALTFGVFAMSTKGTVSVAVIVCAVVLAWFSADAALESSAPTANEGPPPVVSSDVPDQGRPPAESPERTSAATRSTATTADPSPDDATADDAQRVLVLRLVRGRSGGPPLVDATVRLQAVGRRQELESLTGWEVTDAAGRVRFVDPPADPVMVYVDRGGTVRAVEPPAHGTLELEVPVPVGIDVDGLVVDAQGRGVAGATVLVHGPLLEPARLATTDDRGRFACVDVQPGAVLEAVAPGVGRSLGQPIVGTRGEPQRLLLEIASAVRRVAGRVFDADGRAVPNALVAALDVGAAPPSSQAAHARPSFTRADDAGAFVLEATAGSEVVVVAVPPSRDAWAPGRVVLAAGTDEVRADVTLRRAAVLEGTVVAGDEVPIGASVNAWPAVPADDIGWLLNLLGQRRAALDARGSYRLAGLVPGQYSLSVYGKGIQVEHTLPLAEGEHARWDVDVAAGATIHASLDLALRDPRLLPMWNVRIYRVVGAEREFAGVQMVSSDASGVEFSGLAADGEYELVLGALPAGGGQGDLVVARVGPVVPSSRVVPIEIGPIELASLHGTLVDAGGQPVSNRQVTAIGRGTARGSYCRCTADGAGRFRFPALVPGDWQLTVGARGEESMMSVRALVAGEERDLGPTVVE